MLIMSCDYICIRSLPSPFIRACELGMPATPRSCAGLPILLFAGVHAEVNAYKE